MSAVSRTPLNMESELVGVIDGLPNRERNRYKVSNTLIDELASMGVKQLLATCNNKNGIRGALDHFKKLAQSGTLFGLHFVIHGSEDGLWIKSTDEFLPWSEFRDVMSEINNFMRGRLVVNMSSCMGIHGIKIIDTEASELPFYGLIGPGIKITFEEAIRVNREFYKGQLNGVDIPILVEKIKTSTGIKALYAIASDDYKVMRLKKSNHAKKEILEF